MAKPPNWSALALRVRSSITVGNGADAEMVATLDEYGRPSSAGSEDESDPERSIDAAAEVVEAIAMAAGGRGWLCVPSYVVVKIESSSAHLCTCSSNQETQSIPT